MPSAGKFADLTELNDWLAKQCRDVALTHKHPDLPHRTVAEVFNDERGHLLNVTYAFDAYNDSDARVSQTSLVSFDRNRYSVNVAAVGKTVAVRAYADRVTFVHDGELVGIHRRRFGRDQVIYDPWHYLEVLKKKPGALRNGAPFKEWNLPEAVDQMRTALARHRDGDRQFVGILSVIPIYGIDAVEAACADALATKTVSRDVVLNLLSRSSDEPDAGEVRPVSSPSRAGHAADR